MASSSTGAASSSVPQDAGQPVGLDFGGSSMLLAVSLSMVGSLCYVCSLMSVAFPAFMVRTRRKGVQFPVWAQGCFLVLYGLGQLGAAGFSTIASWFGPVSITLPVYMGSMLLWNLVVMTLLQMQSFTKSQQVGTLVLVVATTMLIDAGPTAESSSKSAAELFFNPVAIFWTLVMLVVWGFACAGMVADVIAARPLSYSRLMLIYVMAQVRSHAGGGQYGARARRQQHSPDEPYSPRLTVPRPAQRRP